MANLDHVGPDGMVSFGVVTYKIDCLVVLLFYCLYHVLIATLGVFMLDYLLVLYYNHIIA